MRDILEHKRGRGKGLWCKCKTPVFALLRAIALARKLYYFVRHRFTGFGLLKRNCKIYTRNKRSAFCEAKMFL
ncbi:MAG: hypothetical protein IJ211_02745 [Campylobacter sp.]|nr:hypothetical protein [Campylobacter sp.]